MLGLAVAYFLREGNISLREINWKTWVLFSLGVLLAAFLYRLQYPSFDFIRSMQAVFFRLVREYNRVLQLYFELYPEIQPHMYGTSSSLISSLLGVNIPTSMFPEFYIPQYYVGPAYANTWNTSWIGTAWVDFGFLGVVVESLTIGLLLQWYAQWYSRAPKTALVMGTHVALIMSATKTSEVALLTSFLTFGLISSFMLYLFLRRSPIRRVPINNKANVN